MVPGEVSTRTLGLEPDRFGGPLTHGLPAGGQSCGCYEARTYCAERSALDLVQWISWRLKERRRTHPIGFHALNDLIHAHPESGKSSRHRMTSFGNGDVVREAHNWITFNTVRSKGTWSQEGSTLEFIVLILGRVEQERGEDESSDLKLGILLVLVT